MVRFTTKDVMREKHTELSMIKTFGHHFERVGRKPGKCQDAAQFGLHQGLTGSVHPPPLAQRSHHARGDLWVGRIDLDDEVGEEPITLTPGIVEPYLIAGESADQRASAVRIARIEIRVR